MRKVENSSLACHIGLQVSILNTGVKSTLIYLTGHVDVDILKLQGPNVLIFSAIIAPLTFKWRVLILLYMSNWSL